MAYSSNMCVGFHQATRRYIQEDRTLYYIYCHLLCMCDYRRGTDWILDLLTHLYIPLGTR
jgi:hypothetical protein